MMTMGDPGLISLRRQFTGGAFTNAVYVSILYLLCSALGINATGEKKTLWMVS